MGKVAVPFRGVPDGETQPRDFAVGDEVTGDLARVAAAEGWLEPESAVASATAQAEQFASGLVARVAAALRRTIARLRSLLD